MTDTTGMVYARLEANQAHADFYIRAGQTPPAGLLLEIEHDEALLSSEQHADEAQCLDDARDMREPRAEDENWRLWLVAAGVALIGAAALRWGPWW